jgi:hypothetical protein
MVARIRSCSRLARRAIGGLYAFRGDTGELLAAPRDRMIGTTKFQTLIAADGRLYFTAGGKVYAFVF